ncbi:MAG: bifunctional hydroxymethylpyrimidine kinase/phosphomethylpyrimidine kinase [Verrucomicrobiae bacterium]|nr:bifunctional hydroxymethylpyrimidine kinase/phosphomethylpyrimidine kinase [Verrucomicrobiae bacterium]
MRRSSAVPCALTIAGSDSGGGAGIQADLKTFASLGVHGTSAITCLTAQNPRRVLAIQAATPELLRRQLEAVFEELPPAAIKTGMLYSRALVEAVAGFFTGRTPPSLVVDPVMVATSGARLLRPAAIAALRKRLLPLATVVTPNLDEVPILAGLTVHEPEDLRRAARIIHERYGCAALIKGGHLPGPEAVDVLWDGREEWLLSAPRVQHVSSHGTGCTYSAAITGYLALGCSLDHAVAMAKEYVTQALHQSVRTAAHPLLQHFWTL